MKTYRLTQTTRVVRVYEFEAECEDDALDMMNSGEYEPIFEDEEEDMSGIDVKVVRTKRKAKQKV